MLILCHCACACQETLSPHVKTPIAVLVLKRYERVGQLWHRHHVFVRLEELPA